jgi:hypothetical protein
MCGPTECEMPIIFAEQVQTIRIWKANRIAIGCCEHSHDLRAALNQLSAQLDV